MYGFHVLFFQRIDCFGFYIGMKGANMQTLTPEWELYDLQEILVTKRLEI